MEEKNPRVRVRTYLDYHVDSLRGDRDIFPFEQADVGCIYGF